MDGHQLRHLQHANGRFVHCKSRLWGEQDARGNLLGTAEASTGVYVGCVWQEYQVLLEHLRVTPSVAVLTGSGMNFMVGRVSYTFGLQGAFSWSHPL